MENSKKDLTIGDIFAAAELRVKAKQDKEAVKLLKKIDINTADIKKALATKDSVKTQTLVHVPREKPQKRSNVAVRTSKRPEKKPTGPQMARVPEPEKKPTGIPVAVRVEKPEPKRPKFKKYDDPILQAIEAPFVPERLKQDGPEEPQTATKRDSPKAVIKLAVQVSKPVEKKPEKPEAIPVEKGPVRDENGRFIKSGDTAFKNKSQEAKGKEKENKGLIAGIATAVKSPFVFGKGLFDRLTERDSGQSGVQDAAGTAAAGPLFSALAETIQKAKEDPLLQKLGGAFKKVPEFFKRKNRYIDSKDVKKILIASKLLKPLIGRYLCFIATWLLSALLFRHLTL